jgi:hypothetical protein
LNAGDSGLTPPRPISRSPPENVGSGKFGTPGRPGPDGGVEQFLATAGLDRASQERIAASNWDALVAGIRR